MKSGSLEWDSKLVGGSKPSKTMKCLAGVINEHYVLICTATFISLEYVICPASCIYRTVEDKDQKFYGMKVISKREEREIRYLHVNKKYKGKPGKEFSDNNIGFIAVRHLLLVKYIHITIKQCYCTLLRNNLHLF